MPTGLVLHNDGVGLIYTPLAYFANGDTIIPYATNEFGMIFKMEI